MLSYYFKSTITSLVFSILSTSVFCAAIVSTEVKELDTQFKILSSDFYKNSKYSITKTQFSITNIDSLQKVIKQFINTNDHLSAIQHIIKYKKMIKENIDHDSIFFFVNLLIKYNEWNTAYDLYQYIIIEGDKALVSNIVFIFAKYYINRKNWDKTLNLLSNITDDLAIEDGYYANIMKGIALQNKKKHRPALKHYKTVPKSSQYYIYAQLNIAIVYIRQGWWTDAQLVMNKLLQEKSKYISQQTLVNRLYLVSGYSFLQQEYFRESRNAFRNIQLDSKHANRALLGISLAAASQGDNIGSLNILNRLQDKNTTDLAVEESYLLLPYVYEKLGQHKTASASYSIALAYYQKRLLELNTLLKNVDQKNITINKQLIDISGNKFDITDKYPLSFINNFKELKMFKRNSNHIQLSKNIESLYKKYDSMMLELASDFLTQRRGYIESYLNQSRFGLARLYDNSKKQTQKQ